MSNVLILSHALCSSLTPIATNCRAHVQRGQRRTETPYGMPGAHGVNAHVLVVEEHPILLDVASVSSKPLLYTFTKLRLCYRMHLSISSINKYPITKKV